MLNIKEADTCVKIDRIYTAFNAKRAPDFSFPGESHDFWELVYVIDGCAGIMADSNIYELKNTLNGTFDWNEFTVNSVVIPGGSTISNLSVVLTIELSGNDYVAYIDDLSLSYGDHVVRHNFVNNGYFENGTSGWTLTNTTSSDGIVAIGSSTGHHAVLGDKVLKIL